MKRLEIIEFLKGYSIFTIIVFHYLQYLHFQGFFGQVIFFGGTGVHLFILISGLGLYLSYQRKRLPYIEFLKKRFGKIYIPYILIIAVVAFISLIIPLYRNSLYAFGGHVLLYKMFDESIIGSYGYPMWFMSMIFQFYILFYMITAVKKRMKAYPFILVTLAISLGWALVVDLLGYADKRIWNSFFLSYLWEFAIGMHIASLIFSGNKIKGSGLKPFWFLIIGLGFSGIYGFMAIKGGDSGKMFNDIPALIGYSSLAIWIYLAGIKFINRAMIFFGQIAFPVYLLHTFLLDLSIAIFKTQYMMLNLGIAFGLTILLSIYYQKFIVRFYRTVRIA